MGAQLDEISSAIGGMRSDIQHLTRKVDAMEVTVGTLTSERNSRRGAVSVGQWVVRAIYGFLISGATLIVTKSGAIFLALSK
jgi:hypothetical protein